MTQAQLLANLALCFRCTPEQAQAHIEKHYGTLRNYLDRHQLSDIPIEEGACRG